MPRTVLTQTLTPNVLGYVEGTVAYSRIAKIIEGNELIDSDKARERRGLRAIERPHTTITIDNARVMAVNPQQPTEMEIWLNESLYQSKSDAQSGLSFTAISKSSRLPEIFVGEGIKNLKHATLDAELANGLKVVLVLRSFAGSRGNTGVGLNCVIVKEPIRYRSADVRGDMASQLAQFGFTFADTSSEPAPVMQAPNPQSFPAPTQVQQTQVYSQYPGPTPYPGNPYGEGIVQQPGISADNYQ